MGCSYLEGDTLGDYMQKAIEVRKHTQKLVDIVVPVIRRLLQVASSDAVIDSINI